MLFFKYFQEKNLQLYFVVPHVIQNQYYTCSISNAHFRLEDRVVVSYRSHLSCVRTIGTCSDYSFAKRSVFRSESREYLDIRDSVSRKGLVQYLILIATALSAMYISTFVVLYLKLIMSQYE